MTYKRRTCSSCYKRSALIQKNIRHCGITVRGNVPLRLSCRSCGVEGAPRVEPINALEHRPTPPSFLFNTSLFREKAPALGPKPEQKAERVFLAPRRAHREAIGGTKKKRGAILARTCWGYI